MMGWISVSATYQGWRKRIFNRRSIKNQDCRRSLIDFLPALPLESCVRYSGGRHHPEMAVQYEPSWRECQRLRARAAWAEQPSRHDPRGRAEWRRSTGGRGGLRLSEETAQCRTV